MKKIKIENRAVGPFSEGKKLKLFQRGSKYRI